MYCTERYCYSLKSNLSPRIFWSMSYPARYDMTLVYLRGGIHCFVWIFRFCNYLEKRLKIVLSDSKTFVLSFVHA